MTTWPIGFEDVDFEAAIAWFLRKRVVTRAEWDTMRAASRRKAFTVSNVASLDVVTDVWRAVDRAVAEGQTLDEFKREIGARLEAAWAGTVTDPPWRLETIFRTNVQLAYGAGRYEEMTAPTALEERPMWLYSAVLDSRTTACCKACDGTVLAANHAFWKTHVPPLHFNCRSTIIPLSREQAFAHDPARPAPTAAADEGFGAPPGEDDWAPTPDDYPAPLWRAFEAKAR